MCINWLRTNGKDAYGVVQTVEYISDAVPTLMRKTFEVYPTNRCRWDESEGYVRYV